MADSLAAPLAGVALAAGAGTRLHPLTLLRPKALCPLGDSTLLDESLDRLSALDVDVAVNAHHRSEQVEQHLVDRPTGSTTVHLSIEADGALGTAGAIGLLREWLDGRGALIVNADTWHRADLAVFAEGWDGERVRILTPHRPPFGPRSGVVASILPWRIARELAATPSGLWERVWRTEVAAGRVDVVQHLGTVVDCATPADYLRANMAWSGGASVIGPGAEVHGTLERSVVWPGSVVDAAEHLVDAVRAEGRTVLVRRAVLFRR